MLLAATGVTLNSQTPPLANDGFDPNANGIVNAVAVQPDGKILMAGYFTQLQPFGYTASGHGHIARVNHDGSLDASFSPNADGVIRAMVLQPNGQILIGGSFTSVSPSGGGAAVGRNSAARLNADGSLDGLFNPNTNGTVYAIAFQANGQIVIGGSFTTVQPNGAAAPVTRNHLARFNADGSLDTSFNPNADKTVLALAVQDNGQIVVGGGFATLSPPGASGTTYTRNAIARLNPDGSVDSGFDPEANFSVDVITILPGGKIVIGGAFTTLKPNGAASTIQADFLARLNSDGSLDDGFIVNPLANVNAVAVQPDGRLLIGGTFTSLYPVDAIAPTAINYIARINTDGSIDGSFDPGPDQAVNAIAVQPDGGVVFGGYFQSLRAPGAAQPTTRNFIARVTGDGTIDQTMDPDAQGRIYAAVQTSSGQFYVGGSFATIRGVTRSYLARLNADGSVDTAFSPVINGIVRTIVLGSNGQIVIGGGFTMVDGIARGYIARLNADGSLDGPFNPNADSQVNLIVAVPGTSQYLISGYFSGLTPNGSTPIIANSGFARINADGSLDTSFAPNPQGGSVFAIAFTSDNKMLVGGEFSNIAGFARGYTARLLMSGALDTVAGYDPEPDGPVYALAIQSDGKVVMAGAFNAVIPQTAKVPNPSTNTTTTNAYGQTITYPAPGTSASVPIYINHMARINKDGTLDPSFYPDPSSNVQAFALEPDGSFVVGGLQTSFAQNGNPTGTIRNYLGKVATDGTLDPNFNPNANAPITVVSLLSGGQILVAGNFTALQPNGAPAPIAADHIAILNADGSLNPSFSLGVNTVAAGQVNVAAQLPGGQMLIGGSFSPIYGSTASNLFMLNGDGTPATAFNPIVDGPVTAVAIRPTGSSTPVASSYAVWLENTGTIRHAFSASSSGVVTCVVQQADGKVLVGGLFNNFAGASGFQNIVRINLDGTVDTTFNPTPNGELYTIVVQPSDQKILIGGAFTSIETATGTSVAISYLARLNPDGTVDTSFNPAPNLQVSSIAVQSNGQILAGGAFTAVESGNSTTLVQRNGMARFNSDGSVDKNFNPDLNGTPFAILPLASGEILIGGTFTTITPNETGSAINEESLAELKSDGTVDTSFDPYPNGTVFAITLQPDGNILVGGNFTQFIPNPTLTTNSVGVTTATGTTYSVNYFARLSPKGIPDMTFNPNPDSSVTAITLQANGQIYVGGNFTEFTPNGATIFTTRNFIARLNGDGTVDPKFDPELNSTAAVIDILSDGSLFVGGNFTAVQTGSALMLGGSFTHISGTPAPYLVRLNADSTVDGTFTSNPDGPVNAVTPEASGGTYVGGAFANVGGQPRANLAHINADGSLDATFNPGANGQVNSVAIQNDGQIVVGGAFHVIGGKPVNYLARLAPSGSPDAAFAPALNGAVNSVAVQPNGQIVIAGAFTSVAGQPVGYLARLNADGSLDTAFSPNPDGPVQALILEVDGSCLAGGSFTTIGGQPIAHAAHIEANGAVDTAFNPAPNGTVNTILVQGDGKVVLGGSFTSVGGVSRQMLARLSTPTAVSEELGVSADESTITWTRSAGLPALASVEFQESTDGTHYTSVGHATSSDGLTWTLTGAPPVGSATFLLLAIGVVPASEYSSSGLVEASEAVNTQAIPVIETLGFAQGYSGVPFSFTSVTATRMPVVFSASGLPPGLKINPATGAISGTPTGAGTYVVTLKASNSSGFSTATLTINVGAAAAASFTPAPTSLSNRLLNLSCRAQLSGSNTLIAGFVVSGTGSKSVLLRAVGPGLAAFNVANAMATPELQVYSGAGALITQNTGWGGGSSLSAVFAQVGAFALSPTSADAAVVLSLAPGPYTIHVFDPTRAGGVVLAEIYDASASPLTDSTRLINISARGSVSPGAGALIGGFVISGTSTKSVLIRGVGPGLSGFGVAGFLADPLLTVFASDGTPLAQNSNWTSPTSYSGATEISPNYADINAMDSLAGAFALSPGSADTALLANLQPGAYTFQITSASDSTGEALGEVYELP